MFKEDDGAFQYQIRTNFLQMLPEMNTFVWSLMSLFKIFRGVMIQMLKDNFQGNLLNLFCISTVKASSKRLSFSKTLLNYKTIWTWLHWFWEKFPCFALALSCVTKWMQIILLKVSIHIKYINNQYFFLITLIRLVKDICLNLIFFNIF